VYAGGGFGGYRTTLHVRESLPVEDSTSMRTGDHLGGGLKVPVSPRLGLDLNGRYIFMQKGDEEAQLPTTFDPDFWTTSLGLAFRF
jgi:opacity protein-like surface antigen